jgi:hypothetical protein
MITLIMCDKVLLKVYHLRNKSQFQNKRLCGACILELIETKGNKSTNELVSFVVFKSSILLMNNVLCTVGASTFSRTELLAYRAVPNRAISLRQLIYHLEYLNKSSFSISKQTQ